MSSFALNHPKPARRIYFDGPFRFDGKVWKAAAPAYLLILVVSFVAPVVAYWALVALMWSMTARCLLSFLQGGKQNPAALRRRAHRATVKLTEPALRPWRRTVPPLHLRRSKISLDISPMFLMLVVAFALQVIIVPQLAG